MTLFLLDIASYQGGLRVEDVAAAGFGAVNLKVSHGLGVKSVHPDLPGWIRAARTADLEICTFHFLDGSASGAEQARHAYDRLSALDLTDRTAHQVDCESTASLNVLADYVTTITGLLRRPVAIYTGDWWWKPRGWAGRPLSAFLWAAPNAGYLGHYPGDESPHWAAGYGGWTDLAVMQYAVRPLPGGTTNVSMSAIRDPAVWAALTTGRKSMSFSPATLKAARTLYMETLARAGYTLEPAAVGISRSGSGTSYHLGKSDLVSGSYSVNESSRDRHPTEASSGIDLGWFSINVNGKTHNLRTFSVWMVAQCKAGAADTRDIREIIYSPDGKVVKRWDRLGVRSTGDSSHLYHTHVSRFRDAEDSTSFTDLFRRYFTEIGVLEEDVALESNDLDAIAARVWAHQVNGITAGGRLTQADNRSGSLANSQVPALAVAVASVLTNVQADDGDKAQLLAAIAASQAALAAQAEENVGDVVEGVGELLADPGLTDEQVAAALAAILGARAVPVGVILAAGEPPAA